MGKKKSTHKPVAIIPLTVPLKKNPQSKKEVMAVNQILRVFHHSIFINDGKKLRVSCLPLLAFPACKKALFVEWQHIPLIIGFKAIPFRKKFMEIIKPWSPEELPCTSFIDILCLIIQETLPVLSALNIRDAEKIPKNSRSFQFFDILVKKEREICTHFTLGVEAEYSDALCHSVPFLEKKSAFPPALSLHFPIIAGYSAISASALSTLAEGDVILLEAQIPALKIQKA